jgi:sec-independent protein translocase protein TatB
MFDVSFSEILVIAVVALVVIGPEKLPKVARTLGTIVGRFQRYAAQIREEVNREARFEDLQKLQQEIKAGVVQAVSSVKTEAHALVESTPVVKPAKPKATRKPVVKKILKKTAMAEEVVEVKSAAKPRSKQKPKVAKKVVEVES